MPSTVRGAARAGVLASQVAPEKAPVGDVPIFPLRPTFPGTQPKIYVDEPRWRLLLRRCQSRDGPLGQKGEFGICWLKKDGLISGHGTLVRVAKHIEYPDGHSGIDCVSLRRFRVLRHGVEHGVEETTNQQVSFPKADIEWLDDLQEPDGHYVVNMQLRAKLAPLSEELVRCYQWHEARIVLLRMLGATAFGRISEAVKAGGEVEAHVEAPEGDTEMVWWLLDCLRLPQDTMERLVASRSPTWRSGVALQCIVTLFGRLAAIYEMVFPEEAAVRRVLQAEHEPEVVMEVIRDFDAYKPMS